VPCDVHWCSEFKSGSPLGILRKERSEGPHRLASAGSVPINMGKRLSGKSGLAVERISLTCLRKWANTVHSSNLVRRYTDSVAPNFINSSAPK